jgi:hypothetical protein
MDNCFVLFPAALVAFTVKVDVFASMGVPVIVPSAARPKPAGNVPLAMLHVMGVSPVASSVWLYAVPTVPPGNVAVVILGTVPPPLPSPQAAKENPIIAINPISPNRLMEFFIKHTPAFCPVKSIFWLICIIFSFSGEGVKAGTASKAVPPINYQLPSIPAIITNV